MRRGLTLTELLVAIAVIALLVGLLFPVFVSMRSKGRQFVCASNLRQIAAAVHLYVRDYDGIPPSHPFGWPYPLSFYLRMSLPFPEAHLPMTRTRQLIPTGVFQCPEQPYRQPDPLCPFGWEMYPTLSYGINRVYTDACTCCVDPRLTSKLFIRPLPGTINICGPFSQDWDWPIDATNTVLIVDRSWEDCSPISHMIGKLAPLPFPFHGRCYPPGPPVDEDYLFGRSTEWFKRAFGSPHQGGTNTAFVDGHVKWMLPDKLNERTSTGLLKWWISFKIP